MSYIYFLFDPTWQSKTFYVGKAKNIKRRLQLHLTPSQLKKNTHKNNWLKELLNKEINPSICLICEVPKYITWQEAETQWIMFLKICGIRLANSTSGGEGCVFTEEVKLKMAASHRGKPSGKKGKPNTVHQKQVASFTHKGKPKSIDTRRKMSLSAIGKHRASGADNGNFNHKINNEEVLDLFNRGFTRMQIAEKLNASWSIIDKRLRKVEAL